MTTSSTTGPAGGAAQPARLGRVGYLGALFLAVLPLSTDIVIVALPGIAELYGRSVAGGHQIMAALVIGLAVAHLFVGALADRYGRRPVAIAGFAVYTLAAIAAAIAPSFEALVVARFFQGLSGACGPILARALVRDTVEPSLAPRRMAQISALSGVAPLLTPAIGFLAAQYVAPQAGFFVLAIYGAVTTLLILLLMPETRPAQATRASSWLTPRVLGILLSDRDFIAGSLTLALGYAGLFTWVATGSFFMGATLGLSPLAVSIAFTLGSVCFVAGGIAATRMNAAPDVMIMRGAILGGIAALGALLLAAIAPGSWIMLPLVVPFFSAWGIMQPAGITLAMRHHPTMAGQASAVLGLIQLGGGVIISSIVVSLGAGLVAVILMLVVSLIIGAVSFLRLSRLRA